MFCMELQAGCSIRHLQCQCRRLLRCFDCAVDDSCAVCSIWCRRPARDGGIMAGPRRRSSAPHPTYPCRCGQCGNIDYYLFLSVNSGLDISDSSSKAELKAAFRAAMLRLHPDKISQSGLDPEKATEMSKFLLTVRDTLSDFEKKNSYDIQHSDLWKDSSSDGDSSVTRLPVVNDAGRCRGVVCRGAG